MNKEHIWDRACKKTVKRLNPLSMKMETLEPGVNFFVLSLERLGLQTFFSCEGHPKGFYIVFDAPVWMARLIHSAGYFRVEIERDELWSLRLSEIEMNDEHDKNRTLRWAAESWKQHLGEYLRPQKKEEEE